MGGVNRHRVRVKTDTWILQTWRNMLEVPGVEKPSPTPPLPLWRDVPTDLTLWLHLPAVTSGLHRVAHTRNRVGSGGSAAEVEMSADVGSHEGCGVCPISPPSLPGHCWPWWVCLGLESSAFLLTPVSPCSCLSLNMSFVWGQPSC